MLTESIILTALPAGADREQGVARVTCFVTLRASGADDVLDAAPAFRDWPDVLSRALERLVVEVDGAGELSTQVVSPPPDVGLWRALFPPSTPLIPHAQERWTQRPVATYAGRALHEHAVGLLAEAAASSPTQSPRSPELAAQLAAADDAWGRMVGYDPIRRGDDGPPSTEERAGLADRFSRPLTGQLDRRVAEILQSAAREAARRLDTETGNVIDVNGDFVPVLGTSGTVTDELARFIVFHHRPETPPSPLPDPEELRRDLDFHRIQTAVGGYGFLLRRLGLAVDLVVPLDAVPPDLELVRIVPPDADLPEVSTPWTAYRFAGPDGEPVFRPAPRPEPVGERIAHGLLDLTFGERYGLAQVDVDSASAKVLNAALATTAHAHFPRPPGGVDTDAPPALRSTGIALFHDGRAEALHARLARGHNASVGLGAGDVPVLYAEDVTRGFRLDVLEEREDGRWRSLHRRRGHYVSVGDAAGALDEEAVDEGYVQLALGERPLPPGAPADPTAAVYLHESMARWEGWSLSAPRPGLGMSRSPHAPNDDDPDTQPVPDRNEALPDGVPLEITFHTAGGLPRLRVGGAYRMRARAVDLAGDGPTVAEADAVLEALAASGEPVPIAPGEREEALEFARFEPLHAPPVVLRRPLTEGESVEHVVIRSDHDVSAAEYATTNGGEPDAERHVVPSKVAQQDAELLRSFDEAIGRRDAAATARAYAVALRESGTLDRAVVWDPDLGTERPLAGVEAVPPQPDDPNSGYVIHTEEQLEVPYLPDPWSDGVCFVGLPGVATGTVVQIRADGTTTSAADEPRLDPRPQPGVVIVEWGGRDPWWSVRPLRLQVVEGDGPPGWDAAARVLTVALPKAVQADVRISSWLAEHRLGEHGAWQNIARRLAAAGTDAAPYLQLARTGRMWAVTPARTVRMVHALQRPRHVPDVIALRARRGPGATSAVLAGEIRLHGASTDRIDLDATWTDTIDDPATETAEPGGPRTDVRSAHALSQQILLARDVASEPPSADAQTGRFVEADDLLVLGVAPAAPDAPPFVSTHELHDTRHRWITYTATATSRFREYFPPERSGEPVALTRHSAPVVVDVPSSSPPPPPDLRYAVPLFGWERTEEGRTRTTTRRGGGLRLFLGRPWLASGDGELLGAILWKPPAPACPPPRPVERLVTTWGFDPIWPAAFPPAEPTPVSFRRRVAVGENLPLLEAQDVRVTVVGHEVVYDEARDLWTCDVELDAGSAYTPFVRLGLVRYQPSSVPGAHLSAVTVAQIAQVAPERVVSVTAASDDPLLFSVAVSGPGHGPAWQTGGAPFPYGSDIEVYVERRREGVLDPDLGWQREPAANALLDHGPPPAGNFIRWSGRVRLPATHEPGQHRIVVVERERLASDGPAHFGTPSRTPPTTTRIVFAETFVL